MNSKKSEPRSASKLDIQNILSRATARRKTLLNEGPFRLINQEGDGLGGAAVDIYSGYAAISWYDEGISKIRNDLVEGLLGLSFVKGVYEVERFKSRRKAQNYSHCAGAEAPEFFEASERGLKFLCSFRHGQNAGFFIDNRSNRECISKIAAGKNALNLFAYTGVLSVIAGGAGAASVTTIDISENYNNWARRNLRLNGMDAFSEKVYTFDALDYMMFCAKKSRRFNLIILDPPSFATSLNKKAFSAEQDYFLLVEAAYKILEKPGTLVAICNTAGTGKNDFKNGIREGLEKAGIDGFQVDEGPSMPLDFISSPSNPKLDYLKNLYIYFK